MAPNDPGRTELGNLYLMDTGSKGLRAAGTPTPLSLDSSHLRYYLSSGFKTKGSQYLYPPTFYSTVPGYIGLQTLSLPYSATFGIQYHRSVLTANTMY